MNQRMEALKEVDRVEVLALMDNYVDVLLKGKGLGVISSCSHSKTLRLSGRT